MQNERVFGIHGKLYRIQVEVEPPSADMEELSQEQPTSYQQNGGADKNHNNRNANETDSHKSSKRSDNCSRTSCSGGMAKEAAQGSCQDEMGPPTPTSLLKNKLSEILQNPRRSALDLLLENGNLDDGFSLLREMESWDDDEINTEDGDEDLSVEALNLPGNNAEKSMGSYEEHFPQSNS